MIISYKNNNVQRICNDAAYAARIFEPAVVNNIKLLMVRLHSFPNLDPFFKSELYNKYRTERKKGKMKGLIGFRLGDKERLTLILQEEKIDGQSCIKIMEVSYHYGD